MNTAITVVVGAQRRRAQRRRSQPAFIMIMIMKLVSVVGVILNRMKYPSLLKFGDNYSNPAIIFFSGHQYIRRESVVY